MTTQTVKCKSKPRTWVWRKGETEGKTGECDNYGYKTETISMKGRIQRTPTDKIKSTAWPKGQGGRTKEQDRIQNVKKKIFF